MSAVTPQADILQPIRGTDGYRSNLRSHLPGQMIWVSLGAYNRRRCSPSPPNSICEAKSWGTGLMLKNICTIGAILLLSTISTMAAVPKECAADVKAQCGGVQPGAGRIRACINSHLKDLTPTCQIILVRAAAIGKACRGDVRKICAGVKPGGGRIEACIQSHFTELSASCQFDITRAFHAD
jgi:hypothetical protein